jgi:hypothetical protein
MDTYGEKTQVNKTEAVANSLPKQSDGLFSFQSTENTSGENKQGQIEELANNSEHVKQLRVYQDMSNNSVRVKQLKSIQTLANNSGSIKKFVPIQKKENKTGLPDQLKSGIENLSGFSMDNVKVHYNSSRPAQLQAHAYAQGSEIHVATGQERHLPHEAWHIVQQKQGRVKDSTQFKGININDDEGLEKEADVMGQKALYSTLVPVTNFNYSSTSKNNILQPLKIKPNWTYKGITLSARELLNIFSDEVELRNALLKAGIKDEFLDPIALAHSKHPIKDPSKPNPVPVPGAGDFNLGGHAFHIASGQYVNLGKKDSSNVIYGNKELYTDKEPREVRGEGPDYPMLRDALAYYVMGGNALPGEKATKVMKDAEVASQLRSLLEDPKMDVHPVLAHLVAVMGGAEGLRNPRTPAGLAMYSDLVESGETGILDGLGPGSVGNKKASFGYNMDSIDRAEFFGLSKYKRPEDPSTVNEKKDKKKSKAEENAYDEELRKVKTASAKALNDFIESLDLNAGWKKKIASGPSYRILGGELPMTGGGTAAEGAANVPAVEEEEANDKKSRSDKKQMSAKKSASAVAVSKQSGSKKKAKAKPGSKKDKSKKLDNKDKKSGKKEESDGEEEDDKVKDLNLVQAKEASLVSRWLDIQVLRMSKEQDAYIEAELKKAKDKDKKEIVTSLAIELIRNRLAHLGHSMAIDAKDLPAQKGSSLGSGSSGSEKGSKKGAYVISPYQQAQLAVHQRVDSPVAADGDCFFSSLRSMGHGGGGSVQQMRTILADAVLADAALAAAARRFPFIPDAQRAAVARSIRKMGDYANFAGDVTPMVAAIVWNLTITIINPNVERAVGVGAHAIVILRFTAPAEHYHATAAAPVPAAPIAPAIAVPAANAAAL